MDGSKDKEGVKHEVTSFWKRREGEIDFHFYSSTSPWNDAIDQQTHSAPAATVPAQISAADREWLKAMNVRW